MTADSMTLMVPYRNYDVEPFRVALESMRRQTRMFDEIVVADYASAEPYSSDMESLCKEYGRELGIHYVYTKVDAPHIPPKTLDKILSIHLWQLNYNIGIRHSKSDLIVIAGTDRVFDTNTAEVILDFYNRVSGIRVTGEAWLSGKVKDLHRVPHPSEVDDFDALMNEAQPRGGYGFMATSKRWLHKVQGLDETIRWCADIDLARRARFDDVPVIWVTHGRTVKRFHKQTRILHLATHKKSNRKFGGPDVTDIARRGKWFIHKKDGNRKVLRNDETWGFLTEEKLRRAHAKTEMTAEDLEESLALRRRDPREWLSVYA